MTTTFVGKSQVYNSLKITRADGLSDSNVKSICVDHLGYVWFGTEHGLNRYDGFETVSFYQDINDESTLAHNSVKDIYEDKSGNIFINTSLGLNLYNRGTNTFKRINIGKSSESFLISYEDDRYVWIIGSISGKLWLYDKFDGTHHEEFINFKKHSIDTSFLYFNKVCDFDDRYLLFALSGRGLFLLDKTDKVLKPFLNLSISDCTGLFIDGENVWLSCRYTGVYKIDRKDRTVVNYNVSNSGLKNNIILCFKKHPISNNFWIATDGNGIQEFNQNISLINHFVSGPKVNQILPVNSINTIYFNRKGDIWAGTVRAGAVLLFPGNFEHFSFVENKLAGPSNRTIVKIIEDSEKNIWLATDGGGLNKFDSKTYSFQSFQEEKIDKITGVVQFSENVLLLSEYLGKLYFFNTKSHSFSSAHMHPLLKDIDLKGHYRLFKDSRGNIWIWANKLVKINPLKNTKKVFTQSEYPELYPQISSLFFSVSEDTVKNMLWFGSGKGLYGYNYENNKIEHPVVLNKYRNNFGSVVYSILAMKDSKVLFGTSKGLFIYNPETQLISNYWEENAFLNTVFQTLFEIDDVVWAATSEGLLGITPNTKPQDIIKYQVGNRDFRSSSILMSSDSKVYLGTNNGFIRFSPGLIEEDTLSNPVVITTFDRIGTKKESEFKNTILSNVSTIGNIEIPFSNSVYRFNFNSFNLPFQEKISYSYLLEGFEEVWHTGNSRTATYTNLSPGEYTFKVKASTPTGIWNEQTTKVRFEILPPWWQTTLFRLLFILFVLGIASLIWQESLKMAKLKHLLEVEKNEQKRLKEINQMKLRFFTNISHELRTPLTLIYSPLKKLVGENTTPQIIKSTLPLLLRNAERMKNLVDQILEFRKAEMDELLLETGNYDYIEFCRETIDYFYYQAQIEEVELKLESPHKSLFADFDKDKFSKILFNLVSNALKNTPKGGRIIIEVKQDKDHLVTKVTDTGKGIEESRLENIFERYYQVENDVTGTGIGLALTKRLIELHNGEIKVQSKVGEGTGITFKIPLINSGKVTSIKERTTTDTTNEKEIPEIHSEAKSAPSETLLIIEDDFELRHYLEDEFKSNFKVLLAPNGKAGLELAIEKLPDIIISDVMMPEMNGYEFCKKLKSDLLISHIPVVLLTAKNMTENMIEGYKAGADLYVSKPFDKDVLYSQIEALLKNRELLRDRFTHGFDIKVEEVTHSEMDEKLLHKAIAIVEMNLQNTQFDVNLFVEELGISRTLAYKKIKVITGKTVNEFILSVRLQKAVVLLKKTNKTVSEIAYEIGFTDHSYFSMVFKKNFKISPSVFRQNQQAAE